MGYTLDAYGKPVFSKTPTQTVVDLQAAADFAGEFANVRVGIASDRGALTPGEIRPGMLFSETDTGRLLVALAGGGWRDVHVPDTGNVPLGLVSGWSSTVPAAAARVKGGFTSLNGRLSATAGASTVFATLPAGARPAVQVVTMAYDSAPSTWHTLIIDTNGTMNLLSKTGAIGDLRLDTVSPFPT